MEASGKLGRPNGHTPDSIAYSPYRPEDLLALAAKTGNSRGRARIGLVPTINGRAKGGWVIKE
jgi:hypothetical protein